VSNGHFPLVETTAGGVRWQVAAECRDRLFGPRGLRLDDWLRAGQARVVKNGPHRTVYHVALPGLSFFVKHYRLMDGRAWLRDLVRRSKARLEYRRALAVTARGVDTVVPLGLGEQCTRPGPGDSFLITRALEGTESLSMFVERTFAKLDPSRQTCVRQRLARELGRLLARMHDAGITHNDLHAGNLLVELGPGDEPRLYLIDLHAVALGRPLGWAASRANLMMLNRWFVLRVARSDRLRFWRAYCGSRALTQDWGGGSVSGQREVVARRARDVERQTWLSNLCFWRHRDRRCLVNNRYYRRIRGADVAGYAVTDLDPASLDALVADPDAPFKRAEARLLKDSRSTTVAEHEVSVNGRPRQVIYKRFRVTAWSDPWTALVRQSSALRSWVFGHGLRERCLPTPRPLAVLHRRRHGLSCEGYLLTEKVADAVELHHFVNGLGGLAAPARRVLLHRLIEQVAGLVRGLHARRLSHRDLKAANVLVSREGSESRVWLIDLVGVARCRRLRRERRVQNLARLHASFRRNPLFTRTDKLRFLRVYLQWGVFGRDRWKRWWRAIDRETEAKVARNARNGRPLA